MLTEMGLLTDLRHLNLSGNEVKGPLISEIGLLTKLTRLDLGKSRYSSEHGLVWYMLGTCLAHV